MFKLEKYKITSKSAIMIFIIIFVIVLMSTFAFLYFKNISKSMHASTRLYLTEMSDQSAKTVQDRMAKDFNALNSLSVLITKEKITDTKRILSILSTEAKGSYFKRMGIIFPNGKALTTDGYTIDLKNRKYFEQALMGKASVSDTLIDKTDNKKINVYAVPLYKNNKVVSVLFGTIDNQVYKDILSVKTFGGEGYSYIVKTNGDLIVNPSKNSKVAVGNIFKDKYFLNSKEYILLKNDFSQKKKNLLLIEDLGEKYYLAYAPIKHNDWYLISITPKKLVAKNYENIIKMALYSSVLIIFLFLVLFIYISRLQNDYSKRLEDIAFVDEVTGDNTWVYFKKKATKLISNLNRKYAFIIFDIDKFKLINDIFGWEHGNQTLKFVSKKLRKSLKDGELSARVNNDNYVVLIKYEKESDIVKRILRFRNSLNKYSIAPQTPYRLTLSCGVYRIPRYASDFDIMHNKANFAKNLIKDSPKDSYFFYDDETRNKIVWQNEIEREMHKALSKQQFSVYLQPKYALSNSRIVGAEALVRWKHPEKGLIPPNEFIPIFERNGFIAKLDLFIFESVCKRIREWIEQGKPLVTVSVNISRVNFHNQQLADILYKIASKYQIPVGFIEIEITESAVFENIDNLIGIIKDLRMYGFPVSIDDFGSGYSSLNLLKDLEVDVLKLDREFFNLNTDFERLQKVVSSVITMAKDLNIKTVSEGVETEEHVDFLKEIGCDIAQGYYFARPMPLEEFEKLIFSDMDKLTSVY